MRAVLDAFAQLSSESSPDPGPANDVHRARLPGRLSLVWHAGLQRFIARLAFSRIMVRGTIPVASKGPILFVGLHRNGAMDGFVYRAALGKPLTFLIANQLVRHPLGRLFFSGIGIDRPKDGGDRQGNAAALAACQRLLLSGGRLFVFPEGTSALGPRHLPFKSGAVRIALDALEAGADLTIIPVGIHYECPWAFRAAVEVVMGAPLDLSDLPTTGSGIARIQELKRRITTGLEAVGINVPTQTEFDRLQRLAQLAVESTRHSAFAAQKRWEKGLPTELVTADAEVQTAAAGSAPYLHLGLIDFPLGSVLVPLSVVLLGGPMVLAGLLANAAPVALGAWAARRFPDERNVILLWKILVGVPAWFLWALGSVGVLAARFGLWAATLYAAVTWIAIAAYASVRRAYFQVANAIRHRGLRAKVQQLRTRARYWAGHDGE